MKVMWSRELLSLCVAVFDLGADLGAVLEEVALFAKVAKFVVL